MRLLGRSGAAYVVGTASAQGAKGRIYRVAADGTKTLLAKAHPFVTILSGDGATMSPPRLGRTAASTVTAYNVATATLVVHPSSATTRWPWTPRPTRSSSAAPDKTVIWTTDPPTRSASSPATVATSVTCRPTWSAPSPRTPTTAAAPRSARSRAALPPVALVHRGGRGVQRRRLADRHHRDPVGRPRPRPGRRPHDRRQVAWPLPGPLGLVRGRSGSRPQPPLLLEVNAARKAFTARCTGTACERASDLRPAETLRTASYATLLSPGPGHPLRVACTG